MIPAAFVMLEALPLTANGKVDRRALPAPEQSRGELEYEAPRNEVEAQLAQIWSEVLKVERVGINDNFFELGGDSILSIQIVARGGQAGLQLTPRQLFQHQTIAALSSEVKTAHGESAAEQGTVSGAVALTPIQHWFFEQEMAQREHYNQAVLLRVPRETKAAVLQAVVEQLVAHHDALRLRFEFENGAWRSWNAALETAAVFSRRDLRAWRGEQQAAELERLATEVQQSLNLSAGPLVRAVLFELGEGEQRLLLVVHHLAVDGVSWRILLEDLQRGCEQIAAGGAIAFGAKTSSYQQWAAQLLKEAESGETKQEAEYWRARGESKRLPRDYEGGANSVASTSSVQVSLSAAETKALLQEVPGVYHTQINDALLTAVGIALTEWTGGERVAVELEGHGREEVGGGVDVTRTVGWFTSIYPVELEMARESGIGERLKAVKEALRGVPRHGLGYGLLRYLSSEAEIRKQLHERAAAEVSFNYLGQFGQGIDQTSGWGIATESTGTAGSSDGPRNDLLEIDGHISGGRLKMSWRYSDHVHRRETISKAANRFVHAMQELIAHCQSPTAGGFTPSDFPEAELTQQELDELLAELTN
jgi:non-ribosomal peptide synthase protein (TIGR01720 family)